MDGFITDKQYESFKIPDRKQVQGDGANNVLPQAKTVQPVSLDEGLFYEIEYDSSPIPGVGKFVLKSQKIEEPERDEKRELFGQMREFARERRSPYNSSRFFDQRVQQDNSIVFYKQGMFMKDFLDDYSGNREFSQYFPYYQMMGYEQLRTYFTWRTEVRKGNVAETSLSYAYVYIYELLGNIGVSNPQEGLQQLMSFWTAFSVYNKSIDKYVLRWLKDYHIYYELPHSFKEFVDANNLTEHYPNMVDMNNNFNLYCDVSKYDIRKSTFYTEDKVKLIQDCFYFVTDRLRQTLTDHGMHLDEMIFQPTKRMSEWKPFRGALFYSWVKQRDRQIILSEKEFYMCSNNRWGFNTVITCENGRKLIGYIMKQMEVVLRRITNYKYKLSANINSVTHEGIDRLKEVDISLERLVTDAVTQFYKEETKTVVIVDQVKLSRIRQEALVTQEKLIVADQETVLFVPIQQNLKLSSASKQDKPSETKLDLEFMQESLNIQEMLPAQDKPTGEDLPAIQDDSSKQELKNEPAPASSPWASLKNSLSRTEIEALSVVLDNEGELKEYAYECGIMLEVLADGINEKAMDYIGDNLLDDEFILYEDYKEQVKELIE